jgi:(1->4)-alpha-D-glucan 1-alpha-D-glucosylmutase
MAALRIPGATYRLQMNGAFRFEDARCLVPYFHSLGITDLYTSPILQARRGSTHGYDLTDPARLNSEIGTQEEFESLVAELRQHEMGLLLDIVPNHMAASIENPWWGDVLENGPASIYATYFDIDWHPPDKTLDNKVLLPFLARRYAEALENQELILILEEHGFFLQYADTKLPVALKSYARIVRYRLEDLRRDLGQNASEFLEVSGILAAVAELPERVALSAEVAGERRRKGAGIKERLWRLYTGSPAVHSFLDENLRIFNGTKGQSGSFVPLDELLAEQAYVLSFWHSGTEEINYRRFFSIADLVGMRVEDPLVFDQLHSTILRLVENGAVTGLRIDHIDGLRDPEGYLRRLQDQTAQDATETSQRRFYIVVEKILSRGETLPHNWLAMGTTGYDFLNVLNGLFVNRSGYRSLERTYSHFLQCTPRYEILIYEKKKQIMETMLAVEMRSLGHHLSLLAEKDRYARDFPRPGLAQALIQVTACLPAYRTYTRDFDVAPAERLSIERAVQAARRRSPRVASECFEFLQDVLTLRQQPHLSSGQREARLDFVMRWQQFTGPIMAKGFEDTVLYIHNPLTSLNEVGGAYSSPVSSDEFHDFCSGINTHWPHTLNATTTHDTKRSEDVRARINVLPELAAEWRKHLEQWARWNEDKKSSVEGHVAPDRNEEILLYQTMLGAWPIEPSELGTFKKRLQDYMIKATREAMVHTKWTRPNVKHEEALCQFIDKLMNDSGSNPFLSDFLSFQRKISYYGALKALAQVAMKIAAPGVPDFYQGSELWDLRLVDPDNRGPIDFEKRIRLLAEIQNEEQRGPDFIHQLLEHWEDGRVKLYLISRMLRFRNGHAQLFQEGEYVSLKASGRRAENVCAFIRCAGKSWALTAVPKFVTNLAREGKLPLGRTAWRDTVLELSGEMPHGWKNVLTGETVTATATEGRVVLPMSEVFNSFPVAFLENQSPR